MPTLTEIGAQLSALDALLDAAAGEITPEIETQLTMWLALEADKIDGYASMVKQYQAVAKATEEQAIELSLKAVSANNRAKWLMARMAAHLEERGLTEAKGLVWRFVFQKNGGQPPVEIAGPVPEAYQRVSVTPNLEKIRGDMRLAGVTELSANGHTFARMGEVGRSLRLR